MIIETSSLTDLIVQGNTLEDSVTDIIKQATTNNNLVGDQLWNALIYSGVSLGVQQAGSHFSRQGLQQLSMMREAVNTIQSRMQHIAADDEAFKALSEINVKFLDTLREHAKIVTGVHVETMKDLYSIPAEYVTADGPVENIGVKELQRVGFMAMNKSPVYFFAWENADRDGSVSTMECVCSVCLIGKLTFPVQYAKTINAAIKRLEGLDNLFAAYGAFLITQARNGLYRILEGVDMDHTKQTPNAKDILSTVMRALRGDTKQE